MTLTGAPAIPAAVVILAALVLGTMVYMIDYDRCMRTPGHVQEARYPIAPGEPLTQRMFRQVDVPFHLRSSTVYDPRHGFGWVVEHSANQAIESGEHLTDDHLWDSERFERRSYPTIYVANDGTHYASAKRAVLPRERGQND